ncbi:MAG: hypothetical protein AAB646_02485 [Patescibacteria group bacterium]
MRNRVLISFTIIVLAGILQNSNFLNVLGIKPNLLLVALISLSFVINFFTNYLVFLLIGLFFLRFTMAPELEIFVFTVLSLAAFFLAKRLPWLWAANSIALIFSSTLIFYLLLKPSFIYNHFSVFIGEAIYNSLLGILVFLAIQPRHGDIRRLQHV